MTQDANQSPDTLTKIVVNSGKIVMIQFLFLTGLVSHIALIIYVGLSGFFAKWASIGNNAYFVYAGFIFSFLIYCWSSAVIFNITPFNKTNTKVTKKTFGIWILIQLIAFTAIFLFFPALYNIDNYDYVLFCCFGGPLYLFLLIVSGLVINGQKLEFE